MEENQDTQAPKTRRRPSRRRKDVHTHAHIDGSASWTKLANPNPGLKYIWAYEGSTDTGAAYYESLGFDVEKCTGNGNDPKPGNRRIAKKGEPYRSHGHVLMSIPKEDWDDIQQHGEDGNRGQAHSDMIEERISRQRYGSSDEARLRSAGMYSKPYDGE